jgi:hypothetical protein
MAQSERRGRKSLSRRTKYIMLDFDDESCNNISTSITQTFANNELSYRKTQKD